MNKTIRRKPVRRTISQRSELINDFHSYGINPDTREIVLMSAPDNAEEGIDYVSANTFIKNLLLLNMMNHTPILVHQITCGGDWNYGMAIFDAIAASPSPITLLAHAHARSMSSIIPQAAKRRVIMPNADFLAHFGTDGFEGDTRSFIALGKQAESLDTRMLDIYTSKCAKGPFFKRNKYSRERIREYLKRQLNDKREWYMRPDEAVDKGFMDGVFGTAGFRTFEEIRL
jgi:ATP-dependent protease ClpP protease subunit